MSVEKGIASALFAQFCNYDLIILEVMRHKAVAAIFQTIFQQLVRAAAVSIMIKRTKAKQAIKIFRIGLLVAGKISALSI